MQYALEQPLAIQAEQSERVAFIRRTYLHLAGAFLAFTGILFAIFKWMPAELSEQMLIWRSQPMNAFIIVVAFVGVGYLARWWAMNGGSQAMQYLGLSLYVAFMAFMFVPLIYIVLYYYTDPTILTSAGVLTLCITGGLTTAVFVTRKDFSFLAPIISVASWLAIGVIVLAIFFPAAFNLGMWFSLAMIALCCARILYDTSNVLHHFRTDQHVAASLELFSSIAVLLYYIIMLLLQSKRE